MPSSRPGVRRVLLALIVLSALVLSIQRLRSWLASEPTRIRWRLEEMVEGFNETRLGPCLRGLAEDWRDAGGEVDRALLADYLRSLFFNERDPESGRFPYRAELEPEALEIELDGEREDRARVVAVVGFSTLAGGEWSPTWRVRVRAELEKHPRLGWQARRSEHETLESDGRLVRSR